jgi:host factor-I protein
MMCPGHRQVPLVQYADREDLRAFGPVWWMEMCLPVTWEHTMSAGAVVFNITTVLHGGFPREDRQLFITLNEMPAKVTGRQRQKGPPPGETGQEVAYLRFLSEKQVPVTVKLRDGEAVHGWIEYFDDRMIRLTREGKPNLFIYKNQIRTISESLRHIEARRRERNRVGSGLQPSKPLLEATAVVPALTSSAGLMIVPSSAPFPLPPSSETRVVDARSVETSELDTRSGS